ncbi:MAG: hypothetical protein QOF51_278 [Chloroflexota bacterium]|jgi:hypothetical protein|nr:hypothetical protein [Chloroflexota bacterium]
MSAELLQQLAAEIATVAEEHEADTEQALFYLFLRAGTDAGLFELVGNARRRPSVTIFRELDSGVYFMAERPGIWTAADERALVDETKRALKSVIRRRQQRRRKQEL